MMTLLAEGLENTRDRQKRCGVFNVFVNALKAAGQKVQTGQFRAMMDVALVNDGPVTFVLESRNV